MTEKVCPACDYQTSSQTGRVPTDCPECDATLETVTSRELTDDEQAFLDENPNLSKDELLASRRDDDV